MDTTTFRPPRRLILGAGLGALFAAEMSGPAQAASAAKLDAETSATLNKLYATSGKARELSQKSRAILVFPKITKAGFVVGAHGGNGALRVGGRAVGYYSMYAGSFGFQAGIETLSYVMFIITQSALDYLRKSDGWSIGTGPNVVIVDAGALKALSSTTLTQDVYAVAFGQKGLMAGLTLEGSKITKIHPGP